MTTSISNQIRSVLAAILLTGALLAEVREAKAADPTLLQRLRQLIGLNRSISAGGSRSGASPSVCVISPLTQSGAIGEDRALVSLPRPTILSAGPLNEVRIERGTQVVWRQRASSTAAIEGPIHWPIAPIQPDEVLTLLLRPRGASSADFARILVTGASASVLERNETLLAALGTTPSEWLEAIDHALTHDQPNLAIALLFSAQSPHSEGLDSLRHAVVSRGCNG